MNVSSELSLALWRVIGCQPGHAVFVRAAMSCDGFVEVAVGRRRGRLPFQSGRSPRIVVRNLAAFPDAHKEIDDERDLRQAQHPSRVRNVLIHLDPVMRNSRRIRRHGQNVEHRADEWNVRPPGRFDRNRSASVKSAAIIKAPVNPGKTLREHRLKDQIHEDQREDEMNFSPKLVHVPAGYFREPMIYAGEQRENCSGRNNVVEVGDDVVRIVQMQHGVIEPQGQTREPANSEHRQKREHEKHLRVEPYRAAPERNEKTG